MPFPRLRHCHRAARLRLGRAFLCATLSRGKEIMERKLASIQRVLAIEPIENADAIELARINGWQCVVKKGEFAPGSLGVFLEIDAIPPDSEVFRFLWQPR